MYIIVMVLNPSALEPISQEAPQTKDRRKGSSSNQRAELQLKELALLIISILEARCTNFMQE